MNYFKALEIIFGLAAMLKPVYMHLLLTKGFKTGCSKN